MVVKINNKSDFKINEWSESIALEVPFEFIYYVPLNKEKYVASYDGHSYINCVRLNDGSLDVMFNNHGLGIGRLKVVRKYFIDDLSFADGVFDVISDDQTDVFLTSGKTFDTYVKTLVVPPYIKGDKGDPMTWETMTEKERGELVKDVAEAIDPEMVMTENEKSRQEAERSRQTAEQQRSTTFNTLKGEMQSAITAGNAAAGNAQKVVDEYDEKVAEQDSKLSELGSNLGLRYANQLANGGSGNSSNGYKVRTCGIDIRGYNKLTLLTDKPKNGDSTFYFECLFSSSVDSIGKIYSSNNNPNGFTIVDSKDKVAENTVVDTPENAVSVVIGVYEIPNGGTEGDIVLRVGNFEGYRLGVKLTNETDYSERLNAIEQDIKAISSDIALLPSPSEIPNIDTINGILDLGSDPVLFSGESYFALKSIHESNVDVYRSIPIRDTSNSSSAQIIIFNTSSKTIYPKMYSYKRGSNELILGAVRLSGQKYSSGNFPFKFSVDGKTDDIFINEKISENNQVILSNISTTNIRNGSVGNNSNSLSVSMVNVTDVGYSHSVEMSTDRPVSEGCEYHYSWATYQDSYGVTGNYNNTVVCLRSLDYNVNKGNNLVKLEQGDFGFSFSICEYNSTTGTYNPLRVSDFEGYSFYVKKINANSEVNKLSGCSLLFTTVVPTIKNGTPENSGNAYAVRNNSVIPVKKGDYVVVGYNGTLSSESNIFRYGFAGCKSTKVIDLGKDRTEGVGYAETDGIKNYYTVKSDETKYICVCVTEQDSDGQFISRQGKDGVITVLVVNGVLDDGIQESIEHIQESIEHIQESIEHIQESIEHINAKTAYTRNIAKEIALGAACRQRKSSNTSKDFQILEITDSHNDNVAVRNAVVCTNKFHTIDCMIHCGDMMGDYLTPESSADGFVNEMNLCEKPWFNVIGNHEAGTYNVVGYVPSIAKLRETFVKPMIDKGILKVGEYVEDNCYYYHDFQERSIRLIVLNEYDGDLALDDEYWEAIPYDSTAELMAFGKTYNVGSIIRCNYYKEYSFRCVKQATLGSSIYARSGQEPKYKAIPGSRMINENQAKWFLDILASTPSGYGVIVALHNPFSDNASTTVDKVFCESVQMSGESRSQNYMQTDFIANAVDAFVNGRLYNEKIVYKSGADYRNTKTSGNVKYVYEVSKDFSTKNNNVNFLFYLGGHVHYDLIWRHNTYKYQYQVTPICATVSQHQSPNSDIRRSSIDGLDYDSITVISANPSRKMSLVKLGVDVTENMEKRDIELIDLNQ